MCQAKAPSHGDRELFNISEVDGQRRRRIEKGAVFINNMVLQAQILLRFVTNLTLCGSHQEGRITSMISIDELSYLSVLCCMCLLPITNSCQVQWGQQ